MRPVHAASHQLYRVRGVVTNHHKAAQGGARRRRERNELMVGTCVPDADGLVVAARDELGDVNRVV